MTFKFENLEVWHLALDYVDLMYAIAEQLPPVEQFNLSSQLRRAATSIPLNIAEGSTGQSDAEQNRFLGMALRSLLETVACLRLIERRNYPLASELLNAAEEKGQLLARKLQSFRNSLSGRQIREDQTTYEV